MELLLPIVIQLLQEIPIWFWFSLSVTILHTLDESAGIEPIWEFLRIPAVLYFAFQAFVAFIGLVQPETLIVVRLLDAIVTHGKLNAPGTSTAPLLLIDAVVVARFGCE